jgi:hypothetical protein
MMAEGEELGNPDLVLGQDGLQGVVPPIRLSPLAQARPSDPLSDLPSALASLVTRRPQIVPLDRRG